ncbi:MAG: hypothetical protein COS36_06985 [Candidatus Altarchaeum sp. CG03_land_8_20_14_0_80_32_618]|nr:segregation/condensation protein A [Candidatus Altarchaeum hamiconexum]OIQ05264.1 MAG: hypothetical protein AUK59_04530 [Candidatus Altarchaeum sp. CG2_30_32_3053]PIV27088.1 MAG: hypothetical protein COS36_06985 [Candidatus Altarchaeum sp. CG03_land_8_20_14_0_80_32_618]PJC13239.1 MAG: hypothetical protein CO063_04585 [Candidatus Altarchaeum sp. CG_4_9_14_0_8_um_filter_32_206]
MAELENMPKGIKDIKEGEFWKDVLYEIISTMDPWDVNIVELAKVYSAKIELMKNLNFRIPANALIVCAVLLRMKADVLIPDESKDDDYTDTDVVENDTYDDENIWLPDKLNLTDISLIPKRILKRKISAEELINAINEVLKSERKEIKKKFTEKRIIEITPSADIKKSIDEIYKKIINFLNNSSNKGSNTGSNTSNNNSSSDSVKFSQISDNENIVRNFISLLFLWDEGKILLKQEELYGEIFILLGKIHNKIVA